MWNLRESSFPALLWTPPCVSDPEPRQTGPAAVEVGAGGEAGVGGPRVHGLQTREGITEGEADLRLRDSGSVNTYNV